MIPRTAKFVSPILLLACAMLLAGLTAQAQKGNSTSLSSRQSAEVSAPRAWTREEMLAAKPMPMPERAYAGEIYQMPARPTGPPVSEPGGKGGDSSSATSAEQAIEAALFTSEAPEATAAPAYTYPYPFSRWEHLAGRYGDYPYRTVGKVFFTKFGGGNYVCSGSSIGNYAIITAGHCVSDGLGHFHSNFVFVPAYYNGTAPYGQWSANHLWVRTAWHNGGGDDFEEDIGGAVLNKVSGLKLSQKVGFLGWQANQPIQSHWHSIGYPQSAPFNGSKMIICAAGYARTDVVNGALQTFGIGCDTTGGTSGGPLIRKFANVAGATNYVNGVNSYKYTSSQPLALYSPYFGSNATSIIACLKNSGPGVQKCTTPAAP